MSEKYQVGFLGVNTTARAIMRNLAISVIASDVDQTNLDKLYDLRHVRTTNITHEVVVDSKAIMLNMSAAAAETLLQFLDFSGKIVISTIRGLSFEKLRALTRGKSGRLVRLMPNILASISQSTNVYCEEGLSSDESKFVAMFFSSFGKPFKIEERQMELMQVISASGPAFVFAFIQSFIDIAVKNGLQPSFAKKLVSQMVGGSADLVSAAENELPQLLEQIAPNGSATAEGINVLRETALHEIVEVAVEAALSRATELAGE